MFLLSLHQNYLKSQHKDLTSRHHYLTIKLTNISQDDINVWKEDFSVIMSTFQIIMLTSQRIVDLADINLTSKWQLVALTRCKNKIFSYDDIFLTSRNNDLTSHNKYLTSQHNYLTSDGRNMPPNISKNRKDLIVIYTDISGFKEEKTVNLQKYFLIPSNVHIFIRIGMLHTFKFHI